VKFKRITFFYPGKGIKKESSKKTKLQSGGRCGIIFSEKLSEEEEKFNSTVF